MKDGVPQLNRLLSQGGPVEAASGDEQCSAGVEVGVGGRLWIDHVPVAPQERDQPVGAPKIVLRPRPDGVEAVRVADGGRQQHAVRLSLADGVAALIDAYDAAVGGDVVIEEVFGGGDGPVLGAGLGLGLRTGWSSSAWSPARRSR